MSPEAGPPQQSFLAWVLRALGYEYALLLLLAALVSLVLTLVVAIRGNGPMAGVALVLTVPVPFLIGLFVGIRYAILALNAIAVGAGPSDVSRLAEAISGALVAPLVGLVMTAPGYGVAAIGSLIWSFPNESSVGRGSPDPRWIGGASVLPPGGRG
jgi:hypothetical protein